MPKNPQLEAFDQRIASDGLKETETAVALIWFSTHSKSNIVDVTAREVAGIMMDCRLSGNVNVSRLGQNLSKHSQLVRGGRPASFRIRSSEDAKLSLHFSNHVDLSQAPVGDLLISDSVHLGGRRHLEQIRREANGSYERGFYNAAAVMTRRLAEMLLIEAMEKAGGSAQIRDGSGHLFGFADLIALAQSGTIIRLSRTAPNALQKAKELGDGAAHHRHFVAAKKDLDALNPAYSMLIAELAAAAGL